MLQKFMRRKVDLLLLCSVWVISVYSGQGRQCLEGFVNNTVLREKSMLLGTFSTSTDKTQWIFPSFNFTCSTTITSFQFIAMDTGQAPGKNKLPTLQIWRPQQNSETELRILHKVATNLRSVDGYSNVYSYSNLSLNVGNRDILGFYQPDLKKNRYVLSFQANSERLSTRMRNQRDPRTDFHLLDRSVESDVQDYPLVVVSVEHPECVKGFLASLELSTKSDLFSNPSLATSELVQHDDQIRLIPGLSFGCAGTLISATFTAVRQDTETSHPEFQIWRPFLGSTSVYSREERVSLASSYAGKYLNSFKLVFADPVEVQQDDVLGLYLPSEARSALRLQFLQSERNTDVGSFPDSYSLAQSLSPGFFNINNSELDYDLPLMQVEIIADCGAPLSLPNGSVNVTSTKAHSVARYSCGRGFILVGEEERTCQSETGEWSGSIPHCQAVDCGAPSVPQHGIVHYKLTTYLSLARYECEHGYSLEGEALRLCTSEMIWSGEGPACTGIVCSSLAIPMNGRVEVQRAKDDTQVGAVVHYSCSANHTLLGNSNRTCLDNQMWSGQSPVCVADCPPPPPISNGSVELSGLHTSLFTTAKYTCNEGFMISRQAGSIGSDRLVCGRNSQWMGTLPVCEVVTCEELQPPVFGQVYMINGTSMHSVAYYNCSHGYEISGDHNRTCSADGQWTGNETACVPTTDAVPATATSPPGTEVSLKPVDPPLNNLYLSIVVIIAVLAVVIIVMVIMITVLCIKRRKYKTMEMNIAMANLNDTSVDNPVYEGDQRLSFNLWNSSYGFQFGSTNPESSENNSLYEQPLQLPRCRDLTIELHRHTADRDQTSLPKPSLHYEVSSIVNSSSRKHLYDEAEGKEEKVGHHYDTASNFHSSQYGTPVSPYEVPTPTSKVSNIYGSLPWGSYVPTEEQRRLSSSPIISPPELSRKSQSLDQVFFPESEVYWKPASDSASLYEQLARNRYREILREQIQITDHLGSGQFGTVDKGIWQSPLRVKEVAVKTLKPGSTENDKVKFLQEAAINGQFQHRNVVKLHGVVTTGESVMIVLELLANGDLRNYLLRSRPAPGELVPSDTPQLLLKFCADIAAGMTYLSRKAFIHRDLAARNILVTECKTCKIGDFGLSRDLEDESYYISHGGKIPVKWTAPEALHYKKYSTASDVWSFGCVMYEIWSLGHKPFSGCTNTDTINLIDQGFRLPPPPGCPREIYELMIHCWHPRTSLRPVFTDLHQMLHADMPHIVCKRRPHFNRVQPSVLGGSLETSKDLYPDLQNFHLPGNQ